MKLFIHKNKRGVDINKRYQAVENNKVKELYLWLYSITDTLDYFIKNTSIIYQSQKYWHLLKKYILAILICTL